MKKLFVLAALSLAASGMAFAQSTTSGDVAGTLTDPSGALITNATVKVTNTATGESKTTVSSSTGAFRISLLTPGVYKVVVMASGFSTVTNSVTVAAGAVTADDLRLTIGQGGTVVEVTTEPEVVNTTNGDVQTTFSSEQVQAIPNPGNDLTFVAQTAPGSVMNTGTAAGGYGNFSSFGVSGLSNMFTLDGGYENDPFLNLNNTGASNLTLGNNEVDTVTVVSPAYSSQFGGLGGAQVNEITASGGNHVHGNLEYYWDGRALNSNDWFNKQTQAVTAQEEVASGQPVDIFGTNIPQFVNANQYGASIGGPIIHDKLFFFVNTEGIRAVTPQQGTVYAPNQALQNCSLGADPGGTVTIPGYGAASGTGNNTVTYASCATLNAAADTGAITGTNAAGVGALADGIPFSAAAASQQPLLRRIYNTYNTSPYRPASGVVQDPNDPSAVTYYAHAAEVLTEYLITARVDYRISDKDNFYIHYKEDHGIQPTYTDLISPLFTDSSPQPAWEGQMNETHSFSPRLVNQLVVTGNYYSAPFQNNNPAASVAAAAPETFVFLSGDIANSAVYYGGIDYAFPQGRRVSGYQIIDDVSYTKGRNTLRWGYNFRRDNITDIQGSRTVSPLDEGSVEDFAAGTTDYVHSEYFPQRLTQPVSVYNQGAYIEDAFKVTPRLTITAGLRVERNSNPTCHTNCFSVLANPIATTGTGTALPYDAAFPGGLIAANRHRTFKGYQEYAPMPRIGINYQLSDKTVIRSGFGIFTDTFPGIIADTLLSNAPTNFHAAVYGNTIGGGAINLNLDPTTANSGFAIANASSSAFQTGFYGGSSEAQIASAVALAGGRFSTPNIATVAPFISYPTYEEFSLAVEQRIGQKSSVTATYVGNHGYHEPVENSGNNLTNTKAGTAAFFPTVATTKPFASFATINNVYSGASSNFNGVVFTATRRSRDLTVNLNYELSKALDEISNGGIEPYAPDAGDAATIENPNNLHQQYGPADYNVKHNVTASFVYDLPVLFRTGNTVLKTLVGGFQFSGDVFHNSGLPYTIGQSTSSTSATKAIPAAFANGSINLFAQQLNNNFDHHCGGGLHAEIVATGVVPTPCNFVSSFGTPTNFGQQGRNSLNGPSYTNVDFGAFKTFGVGIPRLEGAKLKLGAQFFNLFNHPNFQNPTHVRNNSNTTLGGIAATVGAPTSILGSTGGADATPRLIQLHAGLVF